MSLPADVKRWRELSGLELSNLKLFLSTQRPPKWMADNQVDGFSLISNGDETARPLLTTSIIQPPVSIFGKHESLAQFQPIGPPRNLEYRRAPARTHRGSAAGCIAAAKPPRRLRPISVTDPYGSVRAHPGTAAPRPAAAYRRLPRDVPRRASSSASNRRMRSSQRSGTGFGTSRSNASRSTLPIRSMSMDRCFVI
jgi:hypothetical protein